MSTPGTRMPTPQIVVRGAGEKAYYEAKFYFQGRQVKRRLGSAWLRPDGTGSWEPRRGRPKDGFFDERAATVEAQRIVEQYVVEFRERDRIATARAARGVSFREVANDYLEWMEKVRGARPSTLRAHRSLLAEPRAYRRGTGRLTRA